MTLRAPISPTRPAALLGATALLLAMLAGAAGAARCRVAMIGRSNSDADGASLALALAGAAALAGWLLVPNAAPARGTLQIGRAHV